MRLGGPCGVVGCLPDWNASLVKRLSAQLKFVSAADGRDFNGACVPIYVLLLVLSFSLVLSSKAVPALRHYALFGLYGPASLNTFRSCEGVHLDVRKVFHMSLGGQTAAC